MYIFAAYNVYEYEVLSRSLTGTSLKPIDLH